MIRLLDKASFIIVMARFTKASGLIISSMDREQKFLSTAQFTKASLKREKNMDMESFNGQINANIKDFLRVASLVGMGSSSGMMEESIKENGNKILWME